MFLFTKKKKATRTQRSHNTVAIILVLFIETYFMLQFRPLLRAKFSFLIPIRRAICLSEPLTLLESETILLNRIRALIF
jgi:hypothetical protein